MVGSSAKASWGDGVVLGCSTGTYGAGVASTRGGGGGRGGDASAIRGGGGGETEATGAGTTGGGGGATFVTGGATGGRPLEAPGMKEKSSANEEEIHGTCSPREARVTPTRVRFSVSSAIRSGTRISLSNSWTNRL